MDGINRRGFFGLLAGGLVAAADPERLLWTPGKRLISIPRPRGTQLLTVSLITDWLLAEFDRNLSFSRRMQQTIPFGNKIGDSLTVRTPHRFVATNRQ